MKKFTLVEAVKEIQRLLSVTQEEGTSFEIKAEDVSIVNADSGEFVCMEVQAEEAVKELTA